MEILLVILLLTIAGVFAVRQLVRAFFYPLPKYMPDPVEESMEAALCRFEAALKEHAPDVLASLQPGLSDDEIAQIEAKHRFRLTEDLKALYRWRNGSLDRTNDALIPTYRFIPLQEVAEVRDVHRNDVSRLSFPMSVVYPIVAGHRTGWLQVLDDLAGDGYFYDPARRRRSGSFFYCFTEVRDYRFFPSVANFLVGAAECYETGIYRSGGRRENHAKSLELWQRYASFAIN